MTFGPARRLLRIKIKRFGGAAKAAEMLGCTREYLYTLISDDTVKRPALDIAAKMEDVLGVPIRAWTKRHTNKAA